MTAPVPILFTIPNFTTAGSGAAMWNIVRRLDRSRFAPAIAISRPGGHLEAEIEGSDVALLRAPFTVDARPLATLPARARRAAAAFRERRFALWHSFHYLDDYTEPLVARFAGAKAWVYTKKNMSWNHRSWLVRSLLARRVAVQNTDMLREFFAGPLLRGRARLVPRGVDTRKFHPETPARLGLRALRGVPASAFVAGCVAQLVPVKDHGTLIRAAASVPGVRLWLAGRELDPAYGASLRSLVGELGVSDRVELLGEVRDVPAFLAELDAFVLPTRNAGRMEGCPVALLEAMSAARACIATDVPGSRDIVRPGQSGIVVPAGGVEAMAAALRELQGDAERRRSLGKAARERILERYSIEREVADHESLYSEILFSEPARRAA